MKIGITHRMFLSILAATSLALLCMFIIMQWSINREFLQYLNSFEQGRLELLAGKLEQAYAENGSWDFLRENPRLFYIMAEQSGDAATAERQKDLNQGIDASPSPFPPPGPHRPRLPFIVTDADRNPIVGNPADAEEANFRPIVHGGKTVGYIGLMSPKHFLGPLQQEFLKRQKSALILSVIGMILVAAILSLPLSSRMVRPIKAMASGTHDLASGRYSVRVPVYSSDELGQLARDFNTMALTLEKNENARRQWVADISHELRTPLSVLLGEIEALLEGIRNTTPESIRSLHAEALRLHRLVDDLYQLSLSDLGTLTYRKEDIDLVEVLDNSIEPYFEDLARKHISLTKDIPPGSNFIVFADEERMYQLFANLIDNSLKYTDTGGELVMRLTCRNNQAVIDFEDTAPGVPAEELDKLFDRLYRVEASRSRATGGAGLGLAICRNIVEAHAGTIFAHPSLLGGVLIRVTIPVAGVCS
ncbi:MAG: two-component system OmpR family sensor histidine kinase BaeS [Nitrospirae bacterium]|nr:MAG: two-component system OmpR family sensor histidine kinase BaeS [Nitrospirota bacterium]